MNDLRRVFIAVNLPEAVRQGLEGLLAKIDAKKARPVERQNLHVTLKFLGYLPPQKVEETKEQLKALAEFRKFDAELQGVGEFGGRVLWVGMTKGAEELRQLSAKLDEALGITDERFHPHVTLARNKELNAAEIRQLLDELGKVAGPWTFTVQSIDLMESRLSSKGPTYGLLFRQELA